MPSRAASVRGHRRPRAHANADPSTRSPARAEQRRRPDRADAAASLEPASGSERQAHASGGASSGRGPGDHLQMKRQTSTPEHADRHVDQNRAPETRSVSSPPTGGPSRAEQAVPMVSQSSQSAFSCGRGSSRAGRSHHRPPVPCSTARATRLRSPATARPARRPEKNQDRQLNTRAPRSVRTSRDRMKSRARRVGGDGTRDARSRTRAAMAGGRWRDAGSSTAERALATMRR